MTLGAVEQVYQWATNHGYSFDYAGSGKAANHPVQTVNWYDCVKWCNARSEMEGLTPAYYTNASSDGGVSHRSRMRPGNQLGELGAAGIGCRRRRSGRRRRGAGPAGIGFRGRMQTRLPGARRTTTAMACGSPITLRCESDQRLSIRPSPTGGLSLHQSGGLFCG